MCKKALLVEHAEEKTGRYPSKDIYKIIKPVRIPFITYPYEWCFSELKDAALVTLKIQKISLEHGMSLKDASSYNIQYLNGKPIFIDTLSFEKYEEGKPWKAYKQFCQHFLAPLVLMRHKDVRLNRLLSNFIDGLPLDLVSMLLPVRTKLNFSIFTHILLHSKAQKKYETSERKKNPGKVSYNGLIGIIDNLESAINKLIWQPKDTEWAEYYNETNYSDKSFLNKKQIIKKFLSTINNIDTLWDLGSNKGEFSRISSDMGIYTIAFDIDPAAVEKNYLDVKKNNEQNLLPVIIDLTNPSPGVGWENKERISIIERGPADATMALALIHHLAISNNLPFEKIANFLSRLGKYLIIEFVPKEDSKVKFLLSSREDIYTDYNQNYFEHIFCNFFNIIKKQQIVDSKRTMYLMSVK